MACSVSEDKVTILYLCSQAVYTFMDLTYPSDGLKMHFFLKMLSPRHPSFPPSPLFQYPHREGRCFAWWKLACGHCERILVSNPSRSSPSVLFLASSLWKQKSWCVCWARLAPTSPSWVRGDSGVVNRLTLVPSSPPRWWRLMVLVLLQKLFWKGTSE